MSRSMVGLLAAVGSALTALAAFAHGGLIPLDIAAAALTTGSAAYLAVNPTKKIVSQKFAREYASEARGRKAILVTV